jgi:hypothetical protein
MDVKDRQRAVIEFLLLEACASEEIVIHLRKMCSSAAYYHDSVFRWMTEARRGNEELRNERRPGRPDRHETDAEIRFIL